MRRIITFFLAMIALLLLAECKKNDGKIVISGYTARDESGAITGTTDTADWRTDRPIPEIVLNTFNTTAYQSVSGATSTHFCSTIMAYPNPTHGVFTLHIANNCYTEYASQYLLVNEKMIVQKNFDFPTGSGATNTSIDVSYLPAGLYRLYYVFRDPHSNIVAQGYGDIQKQ